MNAPLYTIDHGELNSLKRSVVLPVTNGEDSNRAVDWYINNLHHKDDSLYMVCISEPIAFSMDIEGGDWTKALSEQMSKDLSVSMTELKKLGNAYIEKCKAKGINAKFTLYMGSNAETQLVNFIQHTKPYLVVIGNKGFGIVKRNILGSVSDYIIQNSGYPVAVIPPLNRK